MYVTKSTFHSITNELEVIQSEDRGFKAPERTRLRIKLPSGTTVTTFVIPKVTHAPLVSTCRRLVDNSVVDILQSGSPLFECHVPTLLKGLAVKPRLR